MSFGIDWAWGTPTLVSLKKAGVTFACRYLSYDRSKNLTSTEAKTLSAAGIDLVVVWETTANRALAGFDSGAADASTAREQARACGQPVTRPIYFAVDFDESPGQAAAVHRYFAGVASVLGVPRVGVYGGYWVCKRLLDAKAVTYAWQTYAWSGTNRETRAHILQYSNGHVIGGVSCDYNRSLKPDFGQWRVGQPGPKPPAAHPAVHPAAHPAVHHVDPKTKARWLENIKVLSQIIKDHPNWPKPRLDGLRAALKKFREAIKNS